MDAALVHRVSIHASVRMTHRAHLFATPKRLESVARMMQRFGRWCIGFFHHLRQCRRTLWEGCYTAALLDSDASPLACMP